METAGLGRGFGQIFNWRYDTPFGQILGWLDTAPTIHHGVLVILSDPRLPTNNEETNLNPAGVTVVHYELH